MDLQTALIFLDPWLIAPYRWPASASAGYLLGTAILALHCVILGDLSTTAVAYVNRGYLQKIRKKMEHNHRLSEKALMLGDKESFKAVNRQGLEAFGYSFSMGAALFCVSIWPMPFGLAWMNLRFAEAPLSMPAGFPFWGGKDVHYFTSFLLCYLIVRICYAQLMNRLSWYRSLKAVITGAHSPQATVDP